MAYAASIGAVAVAILLALAGGFLAVSAFVVAGSTVQLGIVTAIISVVAIIYNNSRQQDREIKARQFSDKRAAYQKFFDFLFEMMGMQRSGGTLSDEQAIDRMQEIVKDLMIWGSAESINQYNLFIRASIDQSPDNPQKLFENVEALMRSFRKDLGHRDSTLPKLALTKLLLKADEHDKLNG